MEDISTRDAKISLLEGTHTIFIAFNSSNKTSLSREPFAAVNDIFGELDTFKGVVVPSFLLFCDPPGAVKISLGLITICAGAPLPLSLCFDSLEGAVKEELGVTVAVVFEGMLLSALGFDGASGISIT